MEEIREPLYTIRDWYDNFENAASRKRDDLHWVPFPNKHDGEGYGLLMMMEDGPAMFGCFVVIAQVASKRKKNERGPLLRDNGTPHTARTLAIKTKMPEKLITRTLQVLSDENAEIGWLTVVETASDETDNESAVAESATRRPRKEGKKESKKKRGQAAAASRGGAAPRRRSLCQHDNDKDLKACRKCKGKGYIEK